MNKIKTPDKGGCFLMLYHNVIQMAVLAIILVLYLHVAPQLHVFVCSGHVLLTDTSDCLWLTHTTETG